MTTILLILILITIIISSSNEMFLFAIFGKRWMKWTGRLGLKASVISKQNEIDMVQDIIDRKEAQIEEINEALSDGSWMQKYEMTEVKEAINMRDAENATLEMFRADLNRKNKELENAQKKLDFLKK